MNEDIINEIPSGWAVTKLGKYAITQKGKKPKNLSKLKTDKYNIPYVNIKAFEKNEIDEYTDGVNCIFCDDGDFLMVWDGSRSGYVGKAIKGAVGSTLVKLSFPGILNEFAYYFLQSKYLQINTKAKGTGTPHVDPNLLWDYEFPIPPIDEQQRIVNKIQELFIEIDRGIENLKVIQQQLEVYRQAILKSAFEGKLTEEWRKSQKSLPSENDLFEKMQVERNEMVKDSKKRLRSVNIINEDRIKNNSSLPECWTFIRLVNANVEVFDGPFGSNLKSSDYVQDGIRVIRLENIGSLEFFNDKESYISEEKYELLKRHTVSAGDIIFSSFINERTRVVMLPDYIKKAINKADCFCIRVKGETINSKYLEFFLSTRQVFKSLENQVHGVGRPRVNTTQLKNLIIPICSFDEQDKLIQEIELRLSVCDKVEEVIAQSLTQAESLRQSILKKAFDGRLVPQYPNGEPAEN